MPKFSMQFEIEADSRLLSLLLKLRVIRPKCGWVTSPNNRIFPLNPMCPNLVWYKIYLCPKKIG